MDVMSFLNVRLNRVTYWALLGLGAVIMLGGAALFHKPPRINEVVLLFVCIPRLHDIGRSGWWAAGVVLFEWVFAFGLIYLFPSVEQASIAMGVLVLAILGLLIWLGAIRGQIEDNRFGPPPKPGLSLKPRAGTA